MNDFFLKILQKAINHYLSLDPESSKRFKKFHDKVIRVKLLDLSLNFHLIFTQDGINLSADETVKPDTTITGTPLSFLRMTLTRGDRKKFFSEDVSIEGDLELGQQVIDVFDKLEIDWEEYLSHKIGDVPAHHLGRFARNIKKWLRSTRNAFAEDLKDYIHEEKPWFPQREILQDFFNEIDTLRMDVDRMEQRIKELRNK